MCNTAEFGFCEVAASEGRNVFMNVGDERERVSVDWRLVLRWSSSAVPSALVWSCYKIK